MAKKSKNKKATPPPRRRPEPDPTLRVELEDWHETVRRGSLVAMLKKHVRRPGPLDDGLPGQDGRIDDDAVLPGHGSVLC